MTAADPTPSATEPALPLEDPLLAGLATGGTQLPFNRHLGVDVVELTTGRCVTRLRDDAALHNHLAGVHAIAELAPVELAGALAVSSRLRDLLERGFVPVVGGLSVRYTAPAAGELRAHA
jgi:acyl-coenzyme A thioesterase PaaI-like protein